MREEEKKFIRDNSTALVEHIDCNVTLITFLNSKRILSDEDVEEIDSLPTKSKKSKLLLETLKKKENSFKLLKEGLTYSEQSGAVKILSKFPSNCSPPGSSITEQERSQSSGNPKMANETFVPNFGTADLKEEVLQIIQADLIDKLQVENSNTTVILELKSLACFNHNDISPILMNRYTSQQQRMTELFQIISALDPHEIQYCLVRLCNLQQVPKISKRIRNVMENHYPDCFEA